MPDKKQPRMTYRTEYGDYAIRAEYERLQEYELIQKLANRLGKYEDAEQKKEQETHDLCK